MRKIKFSRRVDYDFNRLCKKRNRLRGGIQVVHRIKLLAQGFAKKLNREINKLDEQIRIATNGEIFVTDHAILRYLERVDGLDVDAVLARMALDEIITLVPDGGEYFYKSGNLEYVVKDWTVQTVKLKGRTDLNRVDAFTDADIKKAIESDPDVAPDMSNPPAGIKRVRQKRERK